MNLKRGKGVYMRELRECGGRTKDKTKCAKGKAVTTACELGCIGCKKCIRDLGCPAIVMNDGKICIDASMCTGCHLCSQVCPVCAIAGGDDYE